MIVVGTSLVTLTWLPALIMLALFILCLMVLMVLDWIDYAARCAVLRRGEHAVWVSRNHGGR